MAHAFSVSPEGLLWKLCVFLVGKSVNRAVKQLLLRCVPLRRKLTATATVAIAGWMYKWAEAATIGDYARIDHCWRQVKGLSDWVWEHGWLDHPEVESRIWVSEPTVQGVPKIELDYTVTDPVGGSRTVSERPVIAGIWLEDGTDSQTHLAIDAVERQRWANILAGGEPLPQSWGQMREGKRTATLALVIN